MRSIFFLLVIVAITSCQNSIKRTDKISNNYALIPQPDSDSIAKANVPEKTVFKDSLRYTTVRFYKDTKKNAPSNNANSFAYVKADYPKFADEQKFLTNTVSDIITSKPWTGETAKNIEVATASFFKEYNQFKKDVPESPAGYEWSTNVQVSFEDVDLLVLTTESYIYTGGAHGLESIVYYNLDLKNNKLIDLKELFMANYKTKLTDVAEAIFRKDEGISQTAPLDSYFFENKVFVLNKNFAITTKGLLFTYNPYEIKSYAEGKTNLLVPYSKIKEIIKPDSFISKYIKK